MSASRNRGNRGRRPLTDEVILRRVKQVVGRATDSRFWFFFVDSRRERLDGPVRLELAGLDFRRFGRERVGVAICDGARDAGATHNVVVLERAGGPELMPGDHILFAMAHEAGHDHGVPMWARLLVSDEGARWLGQEDLD